MRNQAVAATAAASAAAAAVVNKTLAEAIAELAAGADSMVLARAMPLATTTRDIAACTRIQRAWRRFASSAEGGAEQNVTGSTNTTAALASAFAALHLSASREGCGFVSL
jgi:hypothetical protein